MPNRDPCTLLDTVRVCYMTDQRPWWASWRVQLLRKSCEQLELATETSSRIPKFTHVSQIGHAGGGAEMPSELEKSAPQNFLFCHIWNGNSFYSGVETKYIDLLNWLPKDDKEAPLTVQYKHKCIQNTPNVSIPYIVMFIQKSNQQADTLHPWQ